MSRIKAYLLAIDYLDRAYELALEDGDLTNVDRSYYMYLTRYVQSFWKCVPVSTIIVAQSPYNRDIFPECASAMSYVSALTEGTFQEIPATVEVLSNDISRTCGCDFDVPADWFRDSWMYAERGVLVINTRSITADGSHNAEREAARLLSFLKYIIESSRGGTKTVTVYTLGNPAKDFGDKLRSCVDTTIIGVTVRSSPHPAYIARRHSDLRSPQCTLGKPAFCRGLYSVIMSSKKAQEAAKERERAALTRDLNAIDSNGRQIANSYSEYVAMLENDTDNDAIPKAVAIQMLTSVADSLIGLCQASRNVSTFMRMSSGSGGSVSGGMGGASTREPNVASRVPPGDVRSMGSQSRAPSVATDVSRTMSPAEIRKARQREKAAAAAKAAGTATPTKAGSVAGAEPPKEAPTPETPMPETPTPSKPTSARLARLAGRSKPSPSAPTVSDSPTLTDKEANSLAIMAEYMSGNRDDAEASGYAEQMMAAVEARSAKDGAARDALRAVRADISKSSNYDAGAYLGLGDDASIVTSNTYQFCTNYPEWTIKS
ncbi:hypothetical protein BJX65DRAFT_291234 [Aspergillus insuetus]